MATNIRLTSTDPAHFHSVDTVIIRVQPSEIITKIVELAHCRICQAQTSSDTLGAAHENCKKEICKICLPTLTHCPSCRENANRLPVGMQTRRVIVAPTQPEPAVVPDHQIALDDAPQGATREDSCILLALVVIIAGVALLKLFF